MRQKSIMLLFVIFVITAPSCDSRPTGNEPKTITFVTTEDWSLSRSAAGSQDCNYKLYYVTFSKNKEGRYQSPSIAPVDLSAGLISLEESIWPKGELLFSSDYEFEWWERWKDSDGAGPVKCIAKIEGTEINVLTCTGSKTACSWRAEKGIIDVENGSFDKDSASGKTRLYFRAWTEGASRVYITADFIDGKVELIKCGKTARYMDAWMIPNSIIHTSESLIPDAAPEMPDMSGCLNEGNYEFPSTSSPLVVKTHIVKPTGEIVREKTVTDIWSVQLLEFSTVDADLHSGIPGAQVVIRDDGTWDEFWRLHKTNAVQMPESPSVDFSRKMVIGVFLGRRPSSCYSVNITSIKVVGGEKLLVIHHEDKPSGDDICAEVITHPSHIVLVDKSDLPVEFISQ